MDDRVNDFNRDENFPKFLNNPKINPKVLNSNDEYFRKNSNALEDASSTTLHYKPISNCIDLVTLRKSKYVNTKEFNDAKYYGEIVKGRRHGQGIMIYNSGRLYEGSWNSDLREGKGFEKFQNGNIYEGYYKNGKPDGNGIYRWKNGEIYDGEWKDGLKSGDGVFKGLNGESYIGEWKNSKPEGYGVYYWENHDKYEGEFLGGLKHGHGCDTFNNGDLLIGEYRYGKPNGWCNYIWKNGSEFKGNYVDGMKEGMGNIKSSRSINSNEYNGLFHKDFKHGFGIYSWESGNKFIGQFKNDERDGLGEMIWVDGSSYLGQWKHGIQHGIGKMRLADGTTREGFFENNIYIGPASLDEYPPELRDPDFTIEMIMPEDFESPQRKRKSRPKLVPKTLNFPDNIPSKAMFSQSEKKLPKNKIYFKHLKSKCFKESPNQNKVINNNKLPKFDNNSKRRYNSKEFFQTRKSNSKFLTSNSLKPVLSENKLIENSNSPSKRKAWIPSGCAHIFQ